VIMDSASFTRRMDTGPATITYAMVVRLTAKYGGSEVSKPVSSKSAESSSR
jgi:hypothetical protein